MTDHIPFGADDASLKKDLASIVSSRYVREPKTSEQLRLFDGLPPSRILALACVDEPDVSRRLTEETLVVLCRSLRSSGETDASWKIALVVAGRVKRSITKTLRVWRLDSPQDEAAELINDLIGEMYSAILDDSQRNKFWEVRFWVAFERRLLTLVRKRRAELDRMVDAGDSVEEIGDARQSGKLNIHNPETSVLIGEALGRMPEAVRTAYILKHVAQMPEESAFEDRTTIAGVLGVTGRTVRNYLQRAERELELWREDKEQGRRRPRNA